jgi:hypothetical protein
MLKDSGSSEIKDAIAIKRACFKNIIAKHQIILAIQAFTIE